VVFAGGNHCKEVKNNFLLPSGYTLVYEMGVKWETLHAHLQSVSKITHDMVTRYSLNNLSDIFTQMRARVREYNRKSSVAAPISSDFEFVDAIRAGDVNKVRAALGRRVAVSDEMVALAKAEVRKVEGQLQNYSDVIAALS
jgi:hypothetical protein